MYEKFYAKTYILKKYVNRFYIFLNYFFWKNKLI